MCYSSCCSCFCLPSLPLPPSPCLYLPPPPSLSDMVTFSYITPRIIAMSYPAQGLEAVYRNKLKDVAELLESKHKDKYLIINVSDRSYDTSFFKNQVRVAPCILCLCRCVCFSVCLCLIFFVSVFLFFFACL